MIYVILAHQEPKRLRQLLEKLQNTDNHFVIHVDKNHDLAPFKKALKEIKNCHFTSERYASHWGSFALIEATLHAFDYIQKKLRKRQRIVLLSGSDYPIKDNIYIKEYFDSNEDTIFLEFKAIPRQGWYTGGINRFPLYEKIKERISLYGGSQWFSIPPKALTILFQFIKANPDFVKYFRHVDIPDECFFQTLFLNCEHPYILKNLTNQNLHFIKWDSPYKHPSVLTIRDYQEIKKSKSLFARKFDSVDSKELLRRLDGDQIKHSVENKQYKTAILFLTNNREQGIKNKYMKLKKEVRGANVFKIVTEKELYESSDDIVLYEHDYCRELGYTPFSEHKIVPGCTYFSILYFKTLYPEYDHYWLIEDDVWYNANWNDFFDFFKNNDADLISAYFTSYHETPNWCWWDALVTEKVISNAYKMRTFYPICRFSAEALVHLDERLKKGDHGHGEVLVPTLLHLHGMSFYDLASTEQMAIIPSSDKAVGDNNNGSFRYRPIISKNEIKGKYLFHPVKEDMDEKQLFNTLNENFFQFNLPGLAYPIKLREGTTDYQTFIEVFKKQEYYVNYDVESNFIIDCGANIGLASIYFKRQFPNANIVAIEPEESNFDLLKENLSYYYPSVKCIRKAVWNKETELHLRNKYAGKWAFSYQEDLESGIDSINSITLDSVLKIFKWNHIDILKIDIEGAELELFSSGYENWLPKTKIILIETHDRFKKGCTTSLINALRNYNFSIEKTGNIVLCMNNNI